MSAVCDDDFLRRFSRLGSKGLQLLDDVHSFDHCAEDHMPVVQPRGLDGGDEELGSVGVWASVGHGHNARPGVLQLEVLIAELRAVNGLAAGTVMVGEVTALAHEVGNHAMESGAFVSETFFSRA